MILTNILLTVFSFFSTPNLIVVNKIINAKMCLEDNLNNLNNYKEYNGLKLY